MFVLAVIVDQNYNKSQDIISQMEVEQGSWSLAEYIIITFVSFIRSLFNLIFLIIGLNGFKKKNYGVAKCTLKCLEMTIFIGILGLAMSMYSGMPDVIYSLCTLGFLFLLYKSYDSYSNRFSCNSFCKISL